MSIPSHQNGLGSDCFSLCEQKYHSSTNSRHWLSWCGGIITFFCAVFLLPLEQVHALSVSPAIKEISIKPNEKAKVKLFLNNDDTFSQNISFDVQNFKDSSTAGIPEIYKDETSKFSQWIDFSKKSIILAPESREEIDVSINVPKNALGGAYFAILVNAEPLSIPDEASVISKQTIAVLLFVTVEGQLQRSANIFDFSVKSRPLLFFPALFNYTIKNTGNTHVMPQGQVRINNILSPYIRSINLNPNHFIVLPGTTRVIEAPWPDSNHMWWSSLNPFRFGIYDAELFFENMKLEGTVRTRFIIISPMGIMMMALLGLFLLYKLLHDGNNVSRVP